VNGGAVRTLVVALAALVVAAAGACAPDRGATYERALAEGERAETAGRYTEASARFDDASRSAKVPRDGAHARYLAAVMLEKAGNTAEARARFDAIAAAEPPSADAALAAYRAAEIRVNAGDDEGWLRFEALLHRFPNSGVARPALYRLLRHHDETRDRSQTILYLRREEASLGKTELGEDLAYQIALRLADLGQTHEARDAFVDVAKRWPYPGGALFDDALFRASELDEQLGRYRDAVVDLERMLDEREVSHLSGSYQRPRYGPALFRVGTLYRDRLRDKDSAREAFHRLYADFTTSPLRDDALWAEAQLWREDGDTGTACARLATLADALPDSRYVPCAMQLCPRVRRSEKSKAPLTCHAYIERREER
jgi:TolA-binding protein